MYNTYSAGNVASLPPRQVNSSYYQPHTLQTQHRESHYAPRDGGYTAASKRSFSQSSSLATPLSSSSSAVGHSSERPRRSLKEMEREACSQVAYEYSQDISHHNAKMERATLCDANMMDLQPELEWSMRPFLMDFLVESHQGLKLNVETLFLAINIIDRYASKRIIYKRHYQLVGCSALWISSKYCDKKQDVPTLQELKTLCCGAYDKHMFVQMESHILNTLGWVIGHPTCDIFVDQLILQGDTSSSSSSSYFNNSPMSRSSECGEKRNWRQVSFYLCETTIFHKSMLKYTASTIAAAAVRFAALVTNSSYQHHQSATESACFEQLVNQVWNSKQDSLTAVDRKYSKRERYYAYNLVQSFMNAAATLQSQREQQQLLQQQQRAVVSGMPTPLSPASSISSSTSSMHQHNNHNNHPSHTHAYSFTTNPNIALRTITPPLQPNEFASLHQQQHHYDPITPVQPPTQYASIHTTNPSSYVLSLSSMNQGNNGGYMTPPFTPSEV